MGDIQDTLKEIKNVSNGKLHEETNANNVVYKGDLEKYFKEVDSCEISSRLLNLLSDMYKEMKKR